jgi:hypothetical protein
MTVNLAPRTRSAIGLQRLLRRPTVHILIGRAAAAVVDEEVGQTLLGSREPRRHDHAPTSERPEPAATTNASDASRRYRAPDSGSSGGEMWRIEHIQGLKRHPPRKLAHASCPGQDSNLRSAAYKALAPVFTRSNPSAPDRPQSLITRGPEVAADSTGKAKGHLRDTRFVVRAERF